VRILILNYEFPPIGGGGATSTFNLTRNLVRLGHDVDVVTMGYHTAPNHQVLDGVQVYRVPCFRRRKEVCDTREMLTYVVSGLIGASRLASRRSYDVNNTHFVFPTGPIGYGLRRISKLPYVLTARGSDVPGHNPNRFRLDHRLLFPAWRRIVSDADAVACVSNDLKREIQRLLPDLAVRVIPNGVSPVGEAAAPPNGVVTPAERAGRILVVTRLHEFKGVQYLLQAVADHRLPFEIHVVGDGPYRATLERQAAGLAGSVRFWGWLDRNQAQLRDLYHRCGIFVFPSDREGAPAALLEAMSEGLAVVAANSAGAPEVVGDAGLLVRPRDSEAIAAALAELVTGPDTIADYGRRARQRVATHFNWRTLAERYVDLYQEVARRTAQGGSREPREARPFGAGKPTTDR
jgi:glycosyltransferase involved in cell wall biosynthesis